MKTKNGFLKMFFLFLSLLLSKKDKFCGKNKKVGFLTEEESAELGRS